MEIENLFPKVNKTILIKDQYDVEVSFTIMNPPLLFSKRQEVKKISWIHGSIEEFLLIVRSVILIDDNWMLLIG